MPNFLAVLSGFSYFPRMSTKTGIYFVGETVIDQTIDRENPSRLVWNPGGSMYFGSIGAAMALKEHGVEKDIGSFYVGPIADDLYQARILDSFNNAGVDQAHVRSTQFTNIIAAVTEKGHGVNKYSFYLNYKPNPNDSLKSSDLPSDFQQEKRIFVMGDIFSALKPDAEILFGFAQEQTRNGDILIYDPNTRPPVIETLDNYRSDVEEWIKIASVAKASEEDIEFIYPDLTHDQVAERWQNLGLSAVFITHGSKGCSVYGGRDKSFVPCIKDSRIEKTIGAGDNFNVGIAVALARQDLVKSWQLASMDKGNWKTIAEEANQTSYRHLLRTNGLG